VFGGAAVTGALKPNMTADWCTSPPDFRPNNTLWVTCNDNGFQILRYTPGPREAVQPGPTPSTTVAPNNRPNSGKSMDDSDDASDSDDSDDTDGLPLAVASGGHAGGSWLPILIAGLGLVTLEIGASMSARRTQ
jgi:hypothetical protein